MLEYIRMVPQVPSPSFGTDPFAYASRSVNSTTPTARGTAAYSTITNSPTGADSGGYGPRLGTVLMTEFTRMLVGTYRTRCWEIPRATRGKTNVTPTKAAKAPAVLRVISPNPNDIRASRAMKSPVIHTARKAPA